MIGHIAPIALNRFVLEHGPGASDPRLFHNVGAAFEAGNVPHRGYQAPSGFPRVLVVSLEGTRYPVLRP